MQSSPISRIVLGGRDFFVKRDDLIDPYLAGNKYRKLYTLLKTPSKKLHTIISYGGTQSNAMLAIAKMCKDKGWEFIYYTKEVSLTQKEQKGGNYYNSLNLGMQHKEIPNELYKDFIASLRVNVADKSFIIDQGGAIEEAYDGLKVLAQEILDAGLDVKTLATPSGTGTTALFLAINLPDYKVYTTPAIGDVEYLKKQMSSLATIPDNLVILKPKRKYHFAKPYKEFYEIYKKTLDAGIEFDLLYAPSMWLSILEQTDEEILYIHSGGVSGNGSMLKRYAQKLLRWH